MYKSFKVLNSKYKHNLQKMLKKVLYRLNYLCLVEVYYIKIGVIQITLKSPQKRKKLCEINTDITHHTQSKHFQ